jgi:hypothetical protein
VGLKSGHLKFSSPREYAHTFLEFLWTIEDLEVDDVASQLDRSTTDPVDRRVRKHFKAAFLAVPSLSGYTIVMAEAQRMRGRNASGTVRYNHCRFRLPFVLSVPSKRVLRLAVMQYPYTRVGHHSIDQR